MSKPHEDGITEEKFFRVDSRARFSAISAMLNPLKSGVLLVFIEVNADRNGFFLWFGIWVSYIRFAS